MKWKKEARRLKSAADAEMAQSLDKDDWAYIEAMPTYLRLPGVQCVLLCVYEGGCILALLYLTYLYFFGRSCHIIQNTKFFSVDYLLNIL